MQNEKEILDLDYVRARIILNQVGFLPESPKRVVVEGLSLDQAHRFAILDVDRRETVWVGELSIHRGDFGSCLIGDFTALRTKGRYRLTVLDPQARGDQVKVGQRHRLMQPLLEAHDQTLDFVIGDDAYTDALHKSINYFSIQRCGDSRTGFNSPCHLDDGIRMDNSERLDVSGGWHDACDVRKWVNCILYGMLGLLTVAESNQTPDVYVKLYEELQWGNKYFLRMQDKEGYVYSYCGGDDGNFFTDNIPGTADDRVIHVDPANLSAQHNFITAEAKLYRLFGDCDLKYGAQCLEAAKRCFVWTAKQKIQRLGEAGTGIVASLELYKATGDKPYLDYAIETADFLLQLQEKEYIGGQKEVRGFFYSNIERSGAGDGDTHDDSLSSLSGLSSTESIVISLFDLLKALPDHEKSSSWREVIRLYVEDFLAAIAKRNPFSLVPIYVYVKDVPPGSRMIGKLGFRYFTKPPRVIGTNRYILSKGIVLAKAAALFKRPEWMVLAQNQLDWVLGFNPFRRSFVSNVGHYNPPHMWAWEQVPYTPIISGAVMNGIVGDEQDRPALRAGSCESCEYWTPHVCYFMWLITELQGCNLK
jgi:hypothetical protein